MKRPSSTKSSTRKSPRQGDSEASRRPAESCPDVVSVRVLEGLRLRLGFEDGTRGDVEIAAVVGEFTGVFARVRRPEYFRSVRVDSRLGTICWPNGADIAPETLFGALSRATRRAPVAKAPAPERHAPGSEATVPEICRFFGLVIQMYFRVNYAPHFHARYAGRKASIEIESLRILSGSLPPRVQGLVAEWTTLHRQELLANWDRARRGRKLKRIAPLE